jgi:hypothetical protein
MYPNADILEFLFATVATIIATLTGLIGAFSTFRLQNIDTEVNFLKGLVLNKKFGNNQSINDFIKGNDYLLLEKIYDSNSKGVKLLEKIVIDNRLDEELNELLIDIDNIRRNQILHDQIKILTIKGFKTSLTFVFVSLILLVFTNGLLLCGQFLWSILFIYLALVTYLFFMFVTQLKKLMY